jgi:hypothetical protein
MYRDIAKGKTDKHVKSLKNNNWGIFLAAGFPILVNTFQI